MSPMQEVTVSVQLSLLLKSFLQQLPGKLVALNQEWLQHEAELTDSHLEQLHRKLHSLTGSTGSYGLGELSRYCRVLDLKFQQHLKQHSLPQGDEILHIRQQFDQLVDISQSNDLQQLHDLIEKAALITFASRNHNRKVYLVDKDESQLSLTRLMLQLHGYQVDVFSDAAIFSAAIQDSLPDLVISGMVFSDGDDTGLQIIETVMQLKEEKIPVIVISARDDIETRQLAFRRGITRYLSKPVDFTRLITMVDRMLDSRLQEQHRVLLVDDEAMTGSIYAELLKRDNIDLKHICDPYQALDAVVEYQPDLVLMDIHMPGINGYELVGVIRQDERYEDLPIVMLSVDADKDAQIKALDSGADDLISKFNETEFTVSIIKKRIHRSKQQQLITDELRDVLREKEYLETAINAHSIVSIADVAGNIIYTNRKFVEISGYSEIELIGKNHRIIKSDEHPPEFFASMWETISSGKVWHGKIRNRRKDNSSYWVNSSIIPFMGDDGLPYKYVSVRTDITDIIETQQALVEANEKLSFLVRNSPVILYIARIVGCHSHLYISENVQNILGYTVEELLARSETWVNAIHPADRIRVLNDYTSLLATGRLSQEYRIRTPGGAYKWVIDELRIMQQEGESEPRIIGYCADISQRKEAMEALKTAKEAAEQASRAKSDFLASMSHELRTPLNAVLGFTQLLQFEIDEQEQPLQFDNLREIERASRHLLSLINEILNLARIESGSTHLENSDFSLTELVHESISMVTPLLEIRQLHLVLDIDPDSADRQIFADFTKLKQVLINLLSNAAKYNKIEGNIRVSARVLHDEYVEISVTDTGPGIAEELQARIFEPFNRLGMEGSTVEGTGIGLVICQRILEMMEGEIGFTSVPGKGSTFWILFPVNASERLINRPTRMATIIFLESAPENLQVVADFVALRNDIRILIAPNISFARDMALEFYPQLFMVDCCGVSQEDLNQLLELKQQPYCRDTRFLGLACGNETLSSMKNTEVFDVIIDEPLSMLVMQDYLKQYLDA